MKSKQTNLNGGNIPRWLLLIFRLPVKQASQRVEVWRKLKRYGALALPAAGHLLPNSDQNRERLEWLASLIRGYKGNASVADVHRIDNLPDGRLVELFKAARARDYQELIVEIQHAIKAGTAQRKLRAMKKRLSDIAEVDFFDSPQRARAEALLDSLSERSAPRKLTVRKSEFQNRTWVTRPRPGIDRVASAWLISQFIDPNAKFAFATDSKNVLNAIPFDMFGEPGFGHVGNDCTFETLMRCFSIDDHKVVDIAEIVHDRDLADEKFGRTEGDAIEQVLAGWAVQGIADEELMKRGMEIFDGLYRHGSGIGSRRKRRSK